LVTWLSYARNANIPVQQYLETQKIFDEQQLANVLAVYGAYEERKTSAKYLDFDDILRRCATILISQRAVRERIVGRILHVLVDEIQDTSTLQWQLLHALRQKATLFCVGDDAQSIYAFRGADFKTVHSFAERVKGADIYYLTQNYRSTQEVLDVSNWLLAESPLKYNKELQAIRGHGSKPLLVECDDDLAQGLWVAGDMDRRHAAGAPWQSMVVLVRTAFAARTVETACIERGIPYVFVGGTSLLKASHVRDVLALLRVALNLNDEVAWMRYLTLWKGVGDRTAERWVQQVGACE
jgi:DNA helicase-2/ATP-dependent DNA helicase PcrA